MTRELEELLDGMKVIPGNDANVAALGEMWKGGGKGHKNVIMVTLGSLSSLGYGPLAVVKIIGMQFLDFFDFMTNSVMMPIAALMTCLLVSKVVGIQRIEEEVMQGESSFRRRKIFIVMIKYLCPVFALIILISSVANAFGWIAM